MKLDVLQSIKLAYKLPAVIVGASLFTALALGIASYNGAASNLKAEIDSKLSAVFESEKVALSEYLDTIRQDLDIVAEDPTTAQAIKDFAEGWSMLGSNQTETLQRLYITDNPHPTGEKDSLDYARDGSYYSRMHRKYHPYFHKLQQERDYYDVFLFDLDGNLVYTVFKELDYATNLESGKWRDTDLGVVFRGARDAESADAYIFEDFEPYEPSFGAPASFIAKQVRDASGALAGVLVYQMPIDKINGVMQRRAGLGETGEAYVVGTDYLMRSDSRFSEESTILKREVRSDAVTAALAGKSGIQEIEDYRGIAVESVYGPLDFMGTRWAVIVEMDSEEVEAPIVGMRNQMLLMVLGLAAIATVLGFLIARGISRPIAQITASMKVLAGGDNDVEVPFHDRGDEIGDIAGAVQVFKDNAIEGERLRAEKVEQDRKAEEAERQAEKEKAERERLEAERLREEEQRAEDAKKQAEEEDAERERVEAEREKEAAEKRRADMLKMADDLEANVGSIVDSVAASATQMQGSATSMASAAQEASAQATTVASASEQTSANVGTVAASAEELSGSITEISRQVALSSEIASEASDKAAKTNETMKGLAAAGARIGEVVNLINEIAEQTNLLALNATIEAARAGEMGKGFAVVASEVKTLASQTSNATQEIAEQVNSVQQETANAVEAIEEIATVVGRMTEISTGIASAVEEQSSATEEIARNVEEAASGTREVSSNIVSVTQASDSTGQSAQEVLSASGQLSDQMSSLKGNIDNFLAEIRAAS